MDIEHRARKKSAVADALLGNLEECTEVVEEDKVCILATLLSRST